MSYTFSKQQAEKRLMEMMPEDVRTLFKAFSTSGSKLYLVGGCVRDSLLIGRVPKDFDVCTDAMPDRVIEILKTAGIEYNLQGEHFAVVVAKMSGGDYEIATFREDVNRNHDIQSFIQYIQEKKPENYEERLRLFIDLSNHKDT